MNTRELLGDNETFVAIISGTLDEFEEDEITTLWSSGILTGCAKTKKLYFPNVTSYSTTNPYVPTFGGNTDIKEIHVPNIVTLPELGFYGCTAITTIDFPNLTTITGSSITFKNCSSLEVLNFPKLETNKFSSSGTWQGMPKLKKILLPKLKTVPKNTLSAYSTYNYGPAFVDEIDISSASSIGDAGFYNCAALKTIKCPNVATIGINAFGKCTKLLNLSFDKLTSIGANAFSSCSSLSKVVIKTSSVCSLSNVNSFNSSTTPNIYVPDELVDSYKEATNWSTYADKIKPLSELPEEEETA